jgi:hypothetical protein
MEHECVRHRAPPDRPYVSSGAHNDVVGWVWAHLIISLSLHSRVAYKLYLSAGCVSWRLPCLPSSSTCTAGSICCLPWSARPEDASAG